jgi:hypothetical protein
MSSGAPSETGVSIRYPSVALLCVDSADGEQYVSANAPLSIAGFRTDTNSPALIQVNKQTPLLFGYMTRVSLTEVNLNWNVPNLNKINNTLTLALYGTFTTPQAYVRIEIPTGEAGGIWYTLPDMAYALQLALNNTSTGATLGGTISYKVMVQGLISDGSVTTEQFSSRPQLIIRSTGGSFAIVPCTVARWTGVTVGTGTYLPAIDDDLTNMLGLTPTIITRATNGLSPYPYYNTLFGGYASCQYTPYIDIISNLLTKNQNVADNSTAKNNTGSKLARIYLNEDGITPRYMSATYNSLGSLVQSSDNAVGVCPFTLHKEFTTPKVISWNTTENVDIIDIQALDYKGRQIFYEASPYQAQNTPDVTVFLANNSADFQYTLQASEI